MERKLLRWKRELPKAYEHVSSDLETHTLVILLCILAKYFSCVRESSSCPPAMARMMASAMRLSCRHRSTALSKFPVSRACVISPSTSARRQECTSKCCHESHWEMQQQVTLSDCTMLAQLPANQPAPGQYLQRCSPSPAASNTHGHSHATGALSSITHLVAEQAPRGLHGLWNNYLNGAIKSQTSTGVSGFCVTQDPLGVSLWTALQAWPSVSSFVSEITQSSCLSAMGYTSAV